MTHYLVIPGLGNSGPEHWQSYWERTSDQFTRIEQTEWDAPNCHDWVAAIDSAVMAHGPANVVLIAHSLGCSTIAHWASSHNRIIRGALLVAPSDIETPQYAFPTRGFAPIPIARLAFPSIVVASENDPWVSLERAQFFAQCWDSEWVNLGQAGHINVQSGYGDWQAGLALLQRFES